MEPKNSGSDLATIIWEWLPSAFQREWSVATNSVSNEEFKKYWPGIDPNIRHIGTLNGIGWILFIHQDHVESFQDLPWGGEGSHERPLKAADPEFFNKLETLLHLIEDYRIRERYARQNGANT